MQIVASKTVLLFKIKMVDFISKFYILNEGIIKKDFAFKASVSQRQKFEFDQSLLKVLRISVF